MMTVRDSLHVGKRQRTVRVVIFVQASIFSYMYTILRENQIIQLVPGIEI